MDTATVNNLLTLALAIFTAGNVYAAVRTSQAATKQAESAAKLVGITEKYAKDTRDLVSVTREYTEQTRLQVAESQRAGKRAALPVLTCQLRMPLPDRGTVDWQVPPWGQYQWLTVENIGAGPALYTKATIRTRNRDNAMIVFDDIQMSLDVISGHPDPFPISGHRVTTDGHSEATVDVTLTYESIHGQRMMTTEVFQSLFKDEEYLWRRLPGEQRISLIVPLELQPATSHTHTSGALTSVQAENTSG